MLLRNSKKLLGRSFPDLLLFDSLYFNKPHFDLVRKELDAHLLIKSSRIQHFREVLKDGRGDADFFPNKDLVDFPIVEKEGFDSVPFFNLLKLFFAAIAAYDILLCILKRNEKEFKAPLNDIKPTWRNI